MLTKDCKHCMIEAHCNESSDGASSYRVDTMETNILDHECQCLCIGRDGSDYDNNKEYDYDSNDDEHYDNEDEGNCDNICNYDKDDMIMRTKKMLTIAMIRYRIMMSDDDDSS